MLDRSSKGLQPTIVPSMASPSFHSINSPPAIAMGSRKDGLLLTQPECAAYSAGISLDSCQMIGLRSCAKCKLLKYCSKECQVAHWPKHKLDCNSPYSKAEWTTRWVKERRVADFVTGSGVTNAGFGHVLHYVWGNIPAIDCLNTTINEGSGSHKRDFNLAFAASGDLRNMLETVNSLPEDYTGQCRILLNDIDITVAGRNAIILYVLLSDASIEIEEAAELCLHLQYSAALTSEQASYASQRCFSLFSDITSPSRGMACDKAIPLRGGGMLHLSLTGIYPVLAMLTSTYTLAAAIASMHAIVLAPSRRDYLDRYLFSLRAHHRVAEMRLRATGVLLPFGASTAHFTEPNRLLFNGGGKWLSQDSASQLSGWDAREVIVSGKKHGCTEEDINGCLYFHVRSQFVEFAKRLRQFKISIHITSMDALPLALCVAQKQGQLHCFSGGFDRVETSNLMDYCGPKAIIESWSPLLNRKNKNSTLMLNSMNWALKEEGALGTSVLGMFSRDRSTMQRCRQYMRAQPQDLLDPRAPTFANFIQNVDAFHDNESAFERYTKRLRIHEDAAHHGLVVKKYNTISPERIAYPMLRKPQAIPPYSEEDWYLLCCIGRVHGTERFLELTFDKGC